MFRIESMNPAYPVRLSKNSACCSAAVFFRVLFARAIGDNEAKHREAMIFGYKEFQRAYRKDDLKLIEYFVNGERNTQLFNMADDPLEMDNLFDNMKFNLKYSEMKAEMIKQMKVMNDTNQIYKELITTQF